MDDQGTAGRRVVSRYVGPWGVVLGRVGVGFFATAQSSPPSLPPSNSWIGCAGMTVEIACLYTSWECASRRSSTQKLSNQVMIPCSFTPLTRKTVTGVLFLRTWFRNTSCTFWDFSVGMRVPLFGFLGPVEPAQRRNVLCRERAD